MPDRFDGAPYAMKVARTVWAQGKGGDNFKPLPMGRTILPPNIFYRSGNPQGYNLKIYNRFSSSFHTALCSIFLKKPINFGTLCPYGNPICRICQPCFLKFFKNFCKFTISLMKIYNFHCLCFQNMLEYPRSLKI